MMQTAAPMSTQSLRWRLLRAVCVAAVLVWTLTGVLSYTQARHEAEELMDGHLALSARLLLALVRDNEDHLADLDERLDQVNTGERDVYEPPLEFQIGSGDGNILLRSDDAPKIPMLGAPGYTEIERDGQTWRLLNLVAPGGDYRIQVAQSMALRERAALEVASQTIWPIGLILPVLLLLIYFSVRRGLKPLDDLAADVAARSPENLAALAGETVPREAQPLVRALNNLLARLGQTLENERRFTADAAHELRTPLAAVKIQTQVALLSQDPAAHDHALRQIQAGVDRSGRLVDQLLRLARLDPMASLSSVQMVDLAALAEETIAGMRDSGAAAQHTLRTSTGGRVVQVSGDRDLLAVALRNLVDNAVRYTPAGTEIRLEISVDRGRPTLAVCDDGPGVTPEDLPRLTERFYRGRANGAEGSGLGLAIVRRIAELHGAALEVANGETGGFVARLVWPGAAAITA
jgi:two-component system, OmpR family, sensor histidine kinase QseC